MKSIRILDLGSGLATRLVCRVMSDLGASMLDDAGTDETRQQRLDNADVVITGGEDRPGRPRHDPAVLIVDRPRLIVVDISGYAPGVAPGPAIDSLVQARTGLVFENTKDRPRLMAMPAPSYGAALQALIGLSAAFLEHRRTGLGQVVRTSLQQGAVFFAHPYWMSAARPDAAFEAVVPKGSRVPIVQCADGRRVHIHPAGGATTGIREALGIAPDETLTGAGYFGDIDAYQARAAAFTSDDLLARLRALQVTCEEVLEPGQCWDDDQVRASGHIVTEADGGRRVGTPLSIRRVGGPVHSKTLPVIGAFSDLKVLDFGHYIAGCYPGRVLADLGAQVIKVEAPTGEAMRRASFRVVHSANAGKDGVAIDLKSAEGRALIQDLVSDASVVSHNFRLGVAERLGLDPASLRRINPGLVTLESSSYGQTGPKAAHPSFDPILVSFAGHAVRAGGEAGEPFWYRNFIVDYAAGALGAIGVLLGLLERESTGLAVEVNIDLLGASLFLMSDLTQTAAGEWVGDAPLDDEQAGRHPAERLYRTLDGWIAVAAVDDDMAMALAGALGLALPARAGWERKERDAISERLGALSTGAALDLLSDAGVWAEACATDGWNALRRAAATSVGLLISDTPDPRYGFISAPAPLFSLSRTSMPAPRTAPAVGQHSRAWLERLGRSPTEIDALIASGAVAIAEVGPPPLRAFVDPLASRA